MNIFYLNDDISITLYHLYHSDIYGFDHYFEEFEIFDGNRNESYSYRFKAPHSSYDFVNKLEEYIIKYLKTN
jgi:hypothetical protein